MGTLFRARARSVASQATERLDERVRVVAPRQWIGLAAALVVVAGVLAWAVFTTMPVEAGGRGVLERPDGVSRVQSPVVGTVVGVESVTGRYVPRGGVVARVVVDGGGAGADRVVDVRAVRGGTVAVTAVAPGSVVHVGDLLTILEPPPGALVAYVYVPVAEAADITPGMRALLSPEGVSPQSAGLIEGRVVRMSDIPVPPERVALIAGGESLGESVSGGEPVIEVVVKPGRDPLAESRLDWTTGTGPDVRLPAGTLLDATIVLGEQRPISRVVPG